MKFTRLKVALAVVIGAAWVMALRPVDASDWYCGGCWPSASPPSHQFPAVPPSTCGVAFTLHAGYGECKQEYPELGSPCKQVRGCLFWFDVLCQGNCGNSIPGVISNEPGAVPLFTPCGTNQSLGYLGCGGLAGVTFFVYDITTGAPALSSSFLSCSPCQITDRDY